MAKLLSMPGPPSDSQEREKALDVQRSWVVEAPAGSGKTGLLIQRYLALLASDSVSNPEDVLAITFTRAATEEIRGRILHELQSVSAPVPAAGTFALTTRSLASRVMERDRTEGWSLLDDPRLLRVQTIDGLCAEIVRALPVAERGAAQLSPVDLAEPMYRLAARRTLLCLGSVDTPETARLHAALRTILLHRDGDLGACEQLIAEMLGSRDQWSDLLPLGAESADEAIVHDEIRARLDRALGQVISDALTRLLLLFPVGTAEALVRLAVDHALVAAEPAGETGLTRAPGTDAASLAQWQVMLRLLVTKGGTWRKRLGPQELGVVLPPSQAEVLKELIATLSLQTGLLEAIRSCFELPPSTYPEDQWFVTKALFSVLHHAVGELAAVFAESGRCDFLEPAILARKALASEDMSSPRDADAASGMPSQIAPKHLLLDEMQDTSSRQYELLERLTKGWDGSTRTVFVVGDPKQSIYLFRQARVERFLQVMHTGFFGSVPLGLLRLTSNFRSRPHLVSSANATFQAVFSAERDAEDQVSYTEAASTRSPVSGSGSDSFAWDLSEVADTEGSRSAIFSQQARRKAARVRQSIEASLAAPLPAGRTEPWRIAVLAQNRRSLQPIIQTLRTDPPLPFRAVDVEPLRERREILDLFALTRAILNPADRTAWLAVLHAPWCGLGLADLHHLAGADDRRLAHRDLLSLVAERGADLSGPSIARLQRVWPMLHSASDLRGELRTPELIERTWRSLGGDRYLAGPAYENALTFLRLLRTLDHEMGQVTLADVQRRIGHLYAAPISTPASIDLMTIHGAKGLEWDIVFLPELERAAPPRRSRLLEWEELANDRGLILAPIPGKGEASQALHRWIRKLHTTRETAERKRLFYVGCTRAREELHLTGTALAHDGEASPNPRSLLQVAWPAAQVHLVATEDSPALMGLSLAAAAEEFPSAPAEEPDLSARDEERPSLIERVPEGFATFKSAESAGVTSTTRSFVPQQSHHRLDGSLTARALGNVVHSMLEFAARMFSQGFTAEQLRHDAAGWAPRYHALLRNEGVGPRDLPAQVQRARRGVERTLSSPLGLWILQSRSDAHVELPLTTWRDKRQAHRIDRTFRAGKTPGSSGDTHLWIIDYKTATHGREGLRAFLEGQQERYQDQMERYAAVLNERSIHLALWFPLLGELRWWRYREPGLDLFGNTLREPAQGKL